MRSKVVRWLAVLALTFVLGGHWAVLQSVAWVTMAVGYSQGEPLKEALIKTFDGKHPCDLCKAVASAKKTEQKQDRSRLLIKLDFMLEPGQAAIFPPLMQSPRFGPLQQIDILTEAPPSPPPRILHG